MSLRIKQIIMEAHIALYTDDAGIVEIRAKRLKILFFDLLPAIISFFIVLKGNTLGKDSQIINNILATCSIFAGLLFSLIIVIVDKAKKIKESKNVTQENEFYYLSRYLRFSKHLIKKIAFTILVSLMIILLSFLANLSFGFGLIIPFLGIYKKYIVSFFIYYFLIQFLYLIVNIVSDMYDVFLEEIGKPN